MSISQIELPEIIPVMPLPGVVLMPHAMLPLFIFERRYREMIADALENERVYAVPQMRPGVQEVCSLEDIFPVAGVGLIRACVNNPDGTSNLILQGLRRVRIRHLCEDHAYRTAKIDEFPAQIETPWLQQKNLEALRELCHGIESAGRALSPMLEEHLRKERADAGDLTDVACSAFVRDPLQLQELLEEPIIGKRIEKLLDFLR